MKTKRSVALVTGGSRGIGLGIAKALGKEGIHLAINGMRDESALEGVMLELRALGVELSYCQGNVALSEDRTKILEKAQTDLGPINFLVNNAGVAPKKRLDILETTEESYDRVMDINLKGAFFLSQSVANQLLIQKGLNPTFEGAIINIGSISATVASFNRGEYCISKAGVGMMTSLFAARLGKEGIPVYEVRPGLTLTDMTTVVKEKYDQLINEGLTAQPRWGFPDDVGKAVAALVRGDFPYSTGQVIMVDGGLTIPRL